MTLNKAGIGNIIQEQTGLSKKKCTEALETALKIIKSELESGEDIMLAPRRVVIFRCSGN